MSSRRTLARGAVVVASLCVAACATDPEGRRAEAALPEHYGVAIEKAAVETPAQAATLSDRWWTLFGDPQLDALVDRALAANLDLRLAAARVDEAASVLGQARAAQWPSLQLGAGVTRARSSTLNGQPVAQPVNTTHRVALSTAFEIDLWGRLRQASAAAQARLLSAQYARDAVQVALAASVVQLHVGLRAFDAQLAVLDEQLSTREASLDLVKRRLAAGAASALDEAQATAALSAARAQRPVLQRQRALLEHQLAVLTAEPGRTQPVARELPAPLAVPVGLPSTLLERRPDVRQAEAALAAADAQVAVARAAWWPTISLTGSFGAQSADLGDLLKAGARTWSIGPSLMATLFDAGRRDAMTAQAKAQAEQAAIAYQQAAQAAFRDVADALSNASFSARQDEEVAHQRTAAREALRLAQRRYEAGYSAYLEVLDAQRGVQDAELAAVQVAQQRLDASIGLVKALGGGWSPQTAPAEARAAR